MGFNRNLKSAHLICCLMCKIRPQVGPPSIKILVSFEGRRMGTTSSCPKASFYQAILSPFGGSSSSWRALVVNPTKLYNANHARSSTCRSRKELEGESLGPHTFGMTAILESNLTQAPHYKRLHEGCVCGCYSVHLSCSPTSID